MQHLQSLLGNTISYDPTTQSQDIDSILRDRFSEDELQEKTLDDLHDPYLLAGMRAAVERIKIAKQKHERVIVFGDYDVDGATSTAILIHLFKKLEFDVSYRLPHRVHDGYGMKKKFVDELAPL